MEPPCMEEKKTVPKTLSVVRRTKPAARGGNAKSIKTFVKSIDHVNAGSRDHVIPLVRVRAIVVMKFIDDIVTDAASVATAKPPRVMPG